MRQLFSILLIFAATLLFCATAQAESGGLCCDNGNHIFVDTGNAGQWCASRGWGGQVRDCAPLKSTQLCCSDGRAIPVDTGNVDAYCRKNGRGLARYCADRPRY